jgi:hypothetical protein
MEFPPHWVCRPPRPRTGEADAFKSSPKGCSAPVFCFGSGTWRLAPTPPAGPADRDSQPLIIPRCRQGRASSCVPLRRSAN